MTSDLTRHYNDYASSRRYKDPDHWMDILGGRPRLEQHEMEGLLQQLQERRRVRSFMYMGERLVWVPHRTTLRRGVRYSNRVIVRLLLEELSFEHAGFERLAVRAADNASMEDLEAEVGYSTPWDRHLSSLLRDCASGTSPA